MSAPITLLTAPASKIIEFSWVTIWDFAIQMLALFVIIWILQKLLFKPVTAFMESRKEAIGKELLEAEAAKNDAHSLKATYEAKMQEIDEEANEILKASRAKGLAREEEIIAAAKVEADGIKQKAEADMKLEQARVKAEMKDEMIEVASAMASKFVEATITEDKQNALVDEIIKEMGDVQWLN